MFPHEAAVSFDLGSVVKNATEPGVSTSTFALVMNPAKYDQLPADLKALIDRTTGLAGAEAFGRMWTEAETIGREKEIAQGVQISTLPDADIARMKQMMAPHVDAAMTAVDKAGSQGRRFYQDYTK
jgi:TRAP-type transport system periplasmic protein